MKTRNIILWSAILNFIGLVIVIILIILCYNKTLSSVFLAIPCVISILLFLVSSQMITFTIKDRLFLMTYEQLIAEVEKQSKAWEKAMKMIKVLGEHEAIKLYNDKHPKSKL